MGQGVLLLCTGLLGLIVGSFLNVVIYRVPRGESVVQPGSHCPACGVAIRPAQNIPVLSWILLRGRCVSCRGRISPRYPLVEAGTAGLFLLVTARVGPTAALPAFLYLAAIAVALSVIDVEVRRLPDRIVLPSYGVALSLLLLAGAIEGDWRPAARGLIAMAALLVLYLILAVAHPGGIGFGDVKLAGLLGLYLGWLGWGAVAVGTFAGFLLGAVVGLTLMATGRVGRKTAIAFGPHMLTGALLTLFVGRPVIDWYASLISPAI